MAFWTLKNFKKYKYWTISKILFVNILKLHWSRFMKETFFIKLKMAVIQYTLWGSTDVFEYIQLPNYNQIAWVFLKGLCWRGDSKKHFECEKKNKMAEIHVFLFFSLNNLYKHKYEPISIVFYCYHLKIALDTWKKLFFQKFKMAATQDYRLFNSFLH
jgi:hypothetical protein